MQEFVKKLIGRLEKLGWVFADYYPDETSINRKRKKSVAYDDVIDIVNQLAEEMGVSKMENTTTNADHIRNMTDEELAEFLCKITMHHPDYCPAYNNCMRKAKGGMKDWLQSEVKGSE